MPALLRIPSCGTRPRRLPRLAPAGLALFAAALAAGCGGDAPLQPWTATVLHAAETKLGGCATGDVLPEVPGDEVVAVAVNGDVHLCWRGAEGWEHAVIHTGAGELIQVAVGDLVPELPGAEILAGGMQEGDEDSGGPGRAVVLCQRDASAPVAERFEVLATWNPQALVHAALIADVDPGRDGLEGYFAGFDRALSGLEFTDVETVSAGQAGILPSDAKGICAHDGAVYVSGSEGELWRWTPGGDPAGEVVFQAEDGLARLAGGEHGVLASSNQGSLFLWDGAEARSIFTEPGGVKGRGAVQADLLPERSGIEAATAGYSGQVHLGRRHTGGWRFEAIHDDGEKLHHLAAGDLNLQVPGLELVCVGYSGRITLLERQP
jgi:hypothetical protein